MTGIRDLSRRGLGHKETRRFMKFFVVGLIGAIVDFGSSNLLLSPMIAVFESVRTGTTVAATISFILAVLSNFVWNRYWTYPDSRSKPLGRQFAQFFLVNATAIVIRVPIVANTVTVFQDIFARFVPSLEQHALRAGMNMAVALAVGIALFWNFFVNRYWTYNDVD